MCGRKASRSGMDSDLEAFSHYPADGSFAALPRQTAAKTNYLKIPRSSQELNNIGSRREMMRVKLFSLLHKTQIATLVE